MPGIDPVVSSAARRRHPQAAAAAAELLEEESTDLGGAQGVSGGARGGHQDYHRAAWPGIAIHLVLISSSSSCIHPGGV